jgi:putative oxidoreductase
VVRCGKYYSDVQRLFSAFPAGPAGFALFLLRVSIAGLFMSIYPARSITGWNGVLVGFEILLAILLCVGVFVPVMTALLCIVQVWLIYGDVNQRHACECFLVLETIALGLLGPGAYSVDSQRFGRRVLKLAEKSF